MTAITGARDYGHPFRMGWNAAMIKHKAAPPYLLKFVELLSQNPMVTERARQKGKSTIHILRRAAIRAAG
jgi:hypothetical protein